MNKKLARIIGCLIVFSFALQLSPAAATSNHLDVQDISQNVAPEGMDLRQDTHLISLMKGLIRNLKHISKLNRTGTTRTTC